MPKISQILQLFRPLENLHFSNPTARLSARILAARQNLICLHTALDGAPLGRALGDELARQIGMQNVRIHGASGTEKLVKIVTFALHENVENVCDAMWSAGAGHIGLYKNASFRSHGIGTFLPTQGANPAIGKVGELERVEETKIEVVAPQNAWKSVVAAMKGAHPYEEVAYDVLALENAEINQSYGPLRLGEIAPISLDNFAREIGEKLGAPGVRLVRSGIETAKIVACSPGSGASFIEKLPRGTVFVSGDFKHHDALLAQNRGVALVDVSHAATETATLKLLREALSGCDVQIETSHEPLNPFENLKNP